MNKVLTTIFLFFYFFASLAFCHTANSYNTLPLTTPESSLVITEFMYNNPGVDDLEFIELYNAGDVPIQMQGYRFSTGVTFTFPNYTLPVDAYVVIAIDSAKFRQAFNISAFQWNAGQQLNNTGELITLLDAANAVLDSVRYSATAAPWPTTANGGGPSVQLCNLAADNSNGANWAASTNGTGFFVSGIEVLATPGAVNNCTPPPPPSYPVYPIGLVTTVSPQGITDSINVRCQLQGTVYGINQRNVGLQFTIIDDENDGIAVFSATNTFGYEVEEGNEITIQGRITQFNGLTQILPDTVILVAQFRPLIPATVVTQLDESTESQLVKLEGLSLVNPEQWTNSGTGFNVDVTNGAASFQVRIVAASNVFGTPAPTGTFNLTGIGGQFDSSVPFTEGYQIFPRYLQDIQLISSSRESNLARLSLHIHPNPARERAVFSSNQAFNQLRITDLAGHNIRNLHFAPVTEYALALEGLLPGWYHVRVSNDGKQIQTARLLLVP
jgi:hypothetical protein